ncbi:hypothetical protein E6C76_03605 [Pseudothauera nasutitermitis]|uniref:Uncharacterized protein n=1 Tax=Pseudothauera nasutitermitis TaxID=2565930 RepID=A0A4S4B458_9RHOO|nr:hypothetical protein [Pseudothauera nasutitermitis]THF67462.1 hypothetical protein E6C76_03605 [Pseudothauera nasutitermitis]
MPAVQQHQTPIPTHVDSIDDFLDATREILTDTVDNWSYLLFPERLRPQIEAAWDDLNFELTRIEIQDADLAEVGLEGAQLDLKLSAVSEALSDFARAPDVRKLLGVFDWLLAVLGSLAAVSKRVEQIKEFIEVLRKLIDAR